MKGLVILIGSVFSLVLLVAFHYADDSKFNGLYLNLGNLARLSHAKTRSISPENFTGEKGKAGMSVDGPAAKAARDLGQGWKVSPYVRIQPKQIFVLAEIEGSTVQLRIRLINAQLYAFWTE